MGPYAFALAAALVAGLLAGLALGTVRLTRLTLGWWRALRERLRRWRTARAGRAAAEDVAQPAASGAPDEPQGPPGPFPRAHGAVASATAVAVLLLAAALAHEPAPLAETTPTAAAPWGGVLVPRPDLRAAGPLGLLAFGLFALAVTLVTALVAAALDRGVHRLALAVARRVPALAPTDASDLELSLSDLRASMVGLWGAGPPRGEPFGVGLGYVALFASPAAALGLLLLAAPGGSLDPATRFAFAAAFLVVPLAYAASAERSQRDEAARLRRRAAVRQLLAAPAWLVAFLALVDGAPAGTRVAAFLALALVLPFALPGASPAASFLSLHRGGDLPEVSPAVRAITGLSHHAWLGAWGALLGLFAAPPPAPLALRFLAGALCLAGLVVVRAGLTLLLAGTRPRAVAGESAP